LLWTAIRLRHQHGGQIDIAKFSLNVKIPGTTEYELVNQLSKYPQLHPRYLGESTNDILLARLRSLLNESNLNQSIKFCLENKMWSFALALSSSISTDLYRSVLDKFISESITDSSLTTTLKSITGISLEFTMENWQLSLASILKHYNSTSQNSLRKLAKFLFEQKDLTAAHVCLVLSSDLIKFQGSDFRLVGSEWNYPNVSSVQMTLLILSSPTTAAFFNYAQFFSMAMIDYGFVEKAKNNVDRIKPGFAYDQENLVFKAAAILQNKISLVSGKRNDSAFKKVLFQFDKLVTQIVHGDKQPSPNEIVKIAPLPQSISTDSFIREEQLDDEDAFLPSDLLQNSPIAMTPQNTDSNENPNQNSKNDSIKSKLPSVKPPPSPVVSATKSETNNEKGGFFSKITSIFGGKKTNSVDLSAHNDGEPFYSHEHKMWMRRNPDGSVSPLSENTGTKLPPPTVSRTSIPSPSEEKIAPPPSVFSNSPHQVFSNPAEQRRANAMKRLFFET
jgi:hypothetical protein